MKLYHWEEPEQRYNSWNLQTKVDITLFVDEIKMLFMERVIDLYSVVRFHLRMLQSRQMINYHIFCTTLIIDFYIKFLQKQNITDQSWFGDNFTKQISKYRMICEYYYFWHNNIGIALTKEGGGSFLIVSIFALSISIQCCDILGLNTIPSQTIKWHFSQFKTKLISTHLFRTFEKFCGQHSEEFQKTKKIIHKYLHNILNKVVEYDCYALLESCWSIAQTKGHPSVYKCAEKASKSHFLLAFRVNGNMKVS